MPKKDKSFTFVLTEENLESIKKASAVKRIPAATFVRNTSVKRAEEILSSS